MSGQRLRCETCGWECRAEKGVTLEDAHDCKGPPSSWPIRAPHPPQGDSAVAAALHASHDPDQTAPQEVYSEVSGYDPLGPAPLLAMSFEEAQRARPGFPLCGAETTLRNDEHRLAQCFEPKDHSGPHRDPRDPAPVEWTDGTTRFSP